MAANLGWSGLSEGQTAKEAAINALAERIDNAVTETLGIALSGATGAISQATLQAIFRVRFTAATVNCIVTLAAIKKATFFENASGKTVTLKVGTTTFVLGNDQSVLVYQDGSTNGLAIVSSSAAASGLPDGGATGDVLTKQSSADGDADWEAPSGGGGGSGIGNIVASYAIGQTSGTRNGSSTYQYNISTVNYNGDGTITVIFEDEVPPNCVPIASGSFNPFANNEGVVCEFGRNSSHSPPDDVNWVNSICLGFKDLRDSTVNYAAPTSWAFMLIDPAGR